MEHLVFFLILTGLSATLNAVVMTRLGTGDLTLDETPVRLLVFVLKYGGLASAVAGVIAWMI